MTVLRSKKGGGGGEAGFAHLHYFNSIKDMTIKLEGHSARKGVSFEIPKMIMTSYVKVHLTPKDFFR